MKKLVAVFLLILCVGNSFGQQGANTKSERTAPPVNKSKPKPAKQKYAVDFKAVDREFLASVKRGDIKFPENDRAHMQRHMRGAETDAVLSWIRNSPVDTVGLLPQFTILIEQIVDEKSATAGRGEIVWLCGWETKQWKEGEETQIPAGTVKIIQKRYSTALGSKTVRGLELQDDIATSRAEQQP